LYETRTGCGNASDEDAKPKRSVSNKSGGIKVRATEANEGWHERWHSLKARRPALRRNRASRNFYFPRYFLGTKWLTGEMAKATVETIESF
jgi:hypothetical protein